MEGGIRRLRDLVDAAPDPTLVVDAHGRIVMINRELETAFGFEQSELLGAPVERLVPARFATAHRTSCEQTFDRPTIRRMGQGLDVFALHKTGTEIPVEVCLAPFWSGDDLHVVASVRQRTRAASRAALDPSGSEVDYL